MNDKLNFLQRYNKDVRIIEEKDMINFLPFIPKTWSNIFKESNMEERIRKTLELWKLSLAQELSLTLSYMENNLITIELITYNDKIAILYGMNHENTSRIIYYEGLLDIDFGENTSLKKSWERVPKSIACFYENIHNGFYYYPSHALGLVSLDEVTYFNDFEWSILDEIEAPISINLEKTFGFFSSGGGGYVAVDLDNKEENVAVIWYDDCEPDYNVNFWDVVDEWILIGFQS